MSTQSQQRRLAEPTGCRVLSCCPLVVLKNVGPSQFPFFSRAESEEGDFFSGTGRPAQEATSHILAGCCGIGSAAAKLEFQSQAFSPTRGLL